MSPHNFSVRTTFHEIPASTILCALRITRIGVHLSTYTKSRLRSLLCTNFRSVKYHSMFMSQNALLKSQERYRPVPKTRTRNRLATNRQNLKHREDSV